MSPGQRCDEIVRLIDESLRVHDLKTLAPVTAARIDDQQPGDKETTTWGFAPLSALLRAAAALAT